MNQQLQATLELSEHSCLTGVSSLYTYPFVRATSVLEGYEFKPGPWVVLLSNQRPKEVDEEDPGTRKALIQFCPFCGASLYPQPAAEKSPGAELIKDGSYETNTTARSVRTAAKLPASKPGA